MQFTELAATLVRSPVAFAAAATQIVPVCARCGMRRRLGSGRAVVCIVAGVASLSMLALAPHVALAVELIERQTSGLAGASSDLWLLARLEGAGAPRVQTGEVVFDVDRRRLDAAAIDGLVSAPLGARLGFATTDPPGNQQHGALQKTGALVDPTTSNPVVTADIAVPPDLVAALGPSLPVTLTATPPGC